MEKIYKVAIVGGGASGLSAAVMLSEKLGGDVIVLERTNRVGKKITVTGNGRGNLTNKNISADNYHAAEGDAPSFVRDALSSFGAEQAEKFLKSLGLILTEENGRVYPASFQASSALDLIRLKLACTGAEVRTDFQVTDVHMGNNAILTSQSGERVIAENVILAAGGMARKEFGTDGAAYSLARKAGHTITGCSPALVQLKTDHSDIRQLKGIRQEVMLTLLDGNMPITCEKGDVLFTEFGVSGDAVFRVSSHLSKCRRPELSIEFLPDVSEYVLAAELAQKVQIADYLTAGDLLTGVVNKQAGRAIVARAGIDPNEKCRKSHVKPVIDVLKDFRLQVLGTLGFQYAQVTRGGIRLREIDSHTMRSKFNKNLYFAGEIMDIDGDCGGYNLHWAFATAYAISREIGAFYGKEIEI